ncbi:MAG: hypothetical protein MUE47_01230 [Acidobacteria bacterium]|nr:hypothetical protein [Acidobacteriota bacterium]
MRGRLQRRTCGGLRVAGLGLLLALVAAAPAALAGVVPSEDPVLARGDEPVVLTGDHLAALLGTSVDRIALFRWDAGSGTFVPIPFQVDERLDVTFSVGGQGDFVEEDMYDVLHLDDGLLDEQDEIVFMFGDGGPQAPSTAAWPAGADGLRYETTARDARSGQPAVTHWAYLFTGPGLARSPARYVTWSGSATGSIATPEFALDYLGNWLLTGYRVAPPCGSGADLIDRLKVRSSPLGYPTVDEEVLDLNSEYLGGIAGPVRALRYVRGAKSGVNTIHYDRVTRGRWTRVVHLRVHPLQQFDVYFDWLPRPYALFFRDGMAGPVAIDGVPDPTVGTGFPAWNLVRGPGGGMFVAYDVPASPLYGQKRLWYRDDAAYDDAPQNGENYPDEDDSAYGTHGLTVLNVLECNFQRLDVSFRVEPLCSSDGSVDLAQAHYELLLDPLEVEATPQSTAVGTVRGLVVTQEGLDVLLHWPPVGGAASYRIYATLALTFPFASWTLEAQVTGTDYRDAGEAARSGAKAYSVVAVGADGTEGLW